MLGFNVGINSGAVAGQTVMHSLIFTSFRVGKVTIRIRMELAGSHPRRSCFNGAASFPNAEGTACLWWIWFLVYGASMGPRSYERGRDRDVQHP